MSHPQTHTKPANSSNVPRRTREGPWWRPVHTVEVFPMVLEAGGWGSRGTDGTILPSSGCSHRYMNKRPSLMHMEGGCHFLHPCWHMRPFCIRGSLPPWSFIHMRLALSPSQALDRVQCPSPLTSPPATPPPKSSGPPQYPETGQQVVSPWRAAPGVHRSRGANPPRKPQPPAYRAGARLQCS